MNPIDSVFIAYGILAIIFLILTLIILRKSLSTVNYLFSLSPILFILVIILNMVDYFITVPPVIARIFYLLAPLGILFAGMYIFFGNDLFKNNLFLIGSAFYILFCVAYGIYMNYVYNSITDGLLHLIVILPVFPALYYYSKLTSIIPESKNAIITLIIGLVFIVIGALMRSYYFFVISTQGDFVPGLALISVGLLIGILSFTAFSGNTNSSTV